jgi:CheY-like chemotaxis protein
MIYGFVRQSGGHLKIYSELGKGTTVKIYFPRADRLDAEPISTVVQQDEAARGEVILLVEDEDNNRRLVSGLLLSLGYVPLEAPDGPTALQIIANTSHIDLLLTDVVLPGGMSGVEVATTAQTRHPSVKVLYMSGYTRNALIHNGVHDENVHLLSKPFRKQELSRAIQKLLKERSSS